MPQSDKPECNLCGGTSFEIIEDDETPYQVLKCTACFLVCVYPFPDNSELQAHYDESYYSDWILAQKNKRIKMWKNRLKKIERIKSPGVLLDVGCGEGTFLQLAQQSGWHIHGTELSPYAAKYASKALDIPIFCGELFNAGYHDHSYDVVTLWHVLEHVTNPKLYLQEVYRILKPDGLLVIAVPNVNDLIMQLAYRIVKRKKLKLFTKGEKEVHLYHFSSETLKAYLYEIGFNCVKLSPDFGIIDKSKKLINFISIIPYYLGGIKIFNAIEVVAKRSEVRPYRNDNIKICEF